MWKQNAFDKANMGVFCKIFASFPVNFWNNLSQFNIASNTKGRYSWWLQIPQETDPNKHLLMCIVSGDEARWVERLEEEKVRDEIQEILAKVFKDKL